MNRNYLIFLSCLFTLTNCGYKIYKNEFGEPILNEKTKYTFTDIPSQIDLSKIDTSAFYVQVFEEHYDNERVKENPQILIFHNDGFFQNESKLYFGKFSEHRTKESTYYGGKYRIKDNTIELEKFYPSRGGATKYYNKIITKGRIEGKKLIFDDGSSLITVFERRNNIN